MKLTTKEVRHVSALAKIRMTDDEIEIMREQLSDILDHFQILRNVDTGNLNPTAHASGVSSIMRDDEPKGSMPLEDALSNVPRRSGKHIRIRAVIEE